MSEERQTILYQHGYFRCPKCGIFFFVYQPEYRYCYHCGQAIDWNIDLEGTYAVVENMDV